MVLTAVWVCGGYEKRCSKSAISGGERERDMLQERELDRQTRQTETECVCVTRAVGVSSAGASLPSSQRSCLCWHHRLHSLVTSLTPICTLSSIILRSERPAGEGREGSQSSSLTRGTRPQHQNVFDSKRQDVDYLDCDFLCGARIYNDLYKTLTCQCTRNRCKFTVSSFKYHCIGTCIT